MEILPGDDSPDIRVGANFLVYESRQRGTTLWGGRYEYLLRRDDRGWRLAAKTVVLVDNDRPLANLAFLI